ncbi:GNAT family N-acetyltransferase [Francisella sp. LA112445]|uniref:GNAT family N-acetyltransferase n=1 Tax=Francisella sp. LA112445 TaxID=1395624 RepID=UPI001788D5E6|nr:GNAT family N-acetyltransferase [Francisella sp. LA112445]QIW11113.1 GNAT family N-acetyltransferase [Francisella sp. LA112445]
MDFSKLLSYENICLRVMQNDDFDKLFKVASDPKIWYQHDDRLRYKREVFKKFFDSGINNPQNCYLIYYKDELVGSTRYYEYDSVTLSIKIGYTFYAKKYWGTELNKNVKKLMLSYAFNFVETVFFDVWVENFRSQKAVEKLGASLYKKDSLRERLIFKLTKEDCLLDFCQIT